MNSKAENSQTSDPSPEPETIDLPESEMRRIRDEMRYASIVWGELHPATKSTPADAILRILSNGFVLLLVGTLFTSILVPKFQHSYEQKKQERSLMEECRAQFLLYSNSIWEEFYLIHPLVAEPFITRQQYDSYFQKITEVKLRRYQSFAKIQSVAIAFRKDGDSESDVEQKLHAYAVSINQVSERIDTWLRRLYCYTALCDNEVIEPDYSSYDAFVAMHDDLDANEGKAKGVSELIVKHLKGDL